MLKCVKFLGGKKKKKKKWVKFLGNLNLVFLKILCL